MAATFAFMSASFEVIALALLWIAALKASELFEMAAIFAAMSALFVVMASALFWIAALKTIELFLIFATFAAMSLAFAAMLNSLTTLSLAMLLVYKIIVSMLFLLFVIRFLRVSISSKRDNIRIPERKKVKTV